jgi:hypothetical protein
MNEAEAGPDQGPPPKLGASVPTVGIDVNTGIATATGVVWAGSRSSAGHPPGTACSRLKTSVRGVGRR